MIHLVRRYEAAGLAAICIEDKLFPKVNSFVAGRQELALVSEFVGKIVAAKYTQQTQDFMVIARVEALIAGHGEDEALRRAEAYATAGADAILIHSKASTPDEILSFLSRWDQQLPVVIVPTTYPSLRADEWVEAGAKVIIYANHGLRAAIRAMSETFDEIMRERSTLTVEGRIASLSDVFELQGMPKMKEDEKRFLSPEGAPVCAVIPAGGDLALPEDLKAIVGGEIPRALLDIYGKPLVRRQAELLAQAGIRDVLLVADVDPERCQLGDIRVARHRGPGVLSSVRVGLSMLEPGPARALVCYSDILFNPSIVRTLIACKDPFVLLASRAFLDDARAEQKSLDYLIVDPSPGPRRQTLDVAPRYTVRSIGKSIPRDRAQLEFIGVLYMNEEGLRIFLDACERFEKSRAEGPFGEAASFAEASLTDLLQGLIDEGQVITAIEQDQGWMEIHSFEDYRAAIQQYSEGAD